MDLSEGDEVLSVRVGSVRCRHCGGLLDHRGVWLHVDGWQARCGRGGTTAEARWVNWHPAGGSI